jgi:hypothetical protein
MSELVGLQNLLRDHLWCDYKPSRELALQIPTIRGRDRKKSHILVPVQVHRTSMRCAECPKPKVNSEFVQSPVRFFPSHSCEPLPLLQARACTGSPRPSPREGASPPPWVAGCPGLRAFITNPLTSDVDLRAPLSPAQGTSQRLCRRRCGGRRTAPDTSLDGSRLRR